MPGHTYRVALRHGSLWRRGSMARGRRAMIVVPRSRIFYSHLGTRPRVLAPVLMGQMARPGISVGDALATSPGGSGHLLALVEIGACRDNEDVEPVQRRREMLRL